MALAVFPNPSARAEWLFAGIIDRALHHWERVPALDGGLGDRDLDDLEPDTAIPDDDDDIVSFASLAHESVLPSSLCFYWFEQDLHPGTLWPCCNLHLENSFEDNGVSGQLVLDKLAFVSDVLHRCFPAALAPTELQRFNKRSSACVVGELVGTADLPQHSVFLSLQILDLTRRQWSDSQGNGVDDNDIFSLAAAVCICIKLSTVRVPALS